MYTHASPLSSQLGEKNERNASVAAGKIRIHERLFFDVGCFFPLFDDHIVYVSKRSRCWEGDFFHFD